MGLQEKILETEFSQNGIQPLEITALRQPEPAGLATEGLFEGADGNAQLQADCLYIRLVGRQKRVGPHAGNEGQLAPFFQFLKHRNNFHVAGAFPAADQGQLPTVIKIHHLRQGFVTAGANTLLFQKVQLLVQMPGKLFQQEFVGKHGKQGRRHAQVQGAGHALLLQAPEHLD